MTRPLHMTDVAIIGAGPVGLFAIFECGMLRLKCHVIDALDMVGGQCAALYPEKPIYDIPAHPNILAQDLVVNLKQQAEPFEPVYHLGQRVEEITRQDTGRFVLKTSTGVEINAGAIIIAAGVGAFGPNRPPLAGIEQYEGNSVHYFVKNRELFRDKRIVIGGGGDSAVDWALSLSEIAAQVTLVHRRAKFRAAPESLVRLEDLAASGKIELAVPYQLSGLEGEGNQLAGVHLEDLDGNKKTVAADYLLPFYGLAMNLGPIANWGLNLDRSHITVDQSTSQTSEAGIYAIGDIAHYPGKLKLILTGFAEAAQAAHAARAMLHPDEVLHFEYSTTKGVPAAAMA